MSITYADVGHRRGRAGRSSCRKRSDGAPSCTRSAPTGEVLVRVLMCGLLVANDCPAPICLSSRRSERSYRYALAIQASGCPLARRMYLVIVPAAQMRSIAPTERAVAVAVVRVLLLGSGWFRGGPWFPETAPSNAGLRSAREFATRVLLGPVRFFLGASGALLL